MIPIYYRRLVLGEEYYVRYSNRRSVMKCIFIRATNKGFNFLNKETSETVIKRHVYAKGMGGKEIPSHRPLKMLFSLPYYVIVSSKEPNFGTRQIK